MYARAAIHRLSLLAAFTSTLLTAGAQKLATATSQDLATAKVTCTQKPLVDLSNPKNLKLENIPALVAAASPLATQIVMTYGSDLSKQPSLSSQWGGFNLAVISAMEPGCIKTEAASSTIKSSQVQSAKTKATTSQTNTQTGAPSSSDGSTSVVQKVGIPQLLGIAVEDGAVTNSVSGTTMTLSTTPYAFAYAFAKNQSTQESYEKSLLLTNLGISTTFNVATSSNPLESATRKDVSQWQAKFTFRDSSTRSGTVNSLYSDPKAGDLGKAADGVLEDITDPRFDIETQKLATPAKEAYDGAWTKSLKTLASQPLAADDTDGSKKIASIAQQILQALDSNSEYQTALAKVADDLSKDPGDISGLIQRFEADDAAYQTAQKRFENAVADVPKGWNGDVSIAQNYPTSTTTASTASSSSTTPTPATPAYLTVEFDVACQPKATPSLQKVPCLPLGSGTFTGNLSGSFYTNPNPVLNETTFRGITAAVQAQWDLGPGFVTRKAPNDKSKMTLSVGSNYQRLQENKDQKGKRADILLGNLKLEIPISSGVSFPLSFSVANATAQLKETYVKGNFGVSFDLDKLASLLKANQWPSGCAR